MALPRLDPSVYMPSPCPGADLAVGRVGLKPQLHNNGAPPLALSNFFRHEREKEGALEVGDDFSPLFY